MAISYSSAAKTACELSDWSLTNLALHKLLYLSHMEFLGETGGEPLISTNFEAWKYGPVIAPLYHRVKIYGSRPIPDIFRVTRNMRLREHAAIAATIEKYGDRTPGELVELTHRPEGAWSLYFDSGEMGIVIPNHAILQEYRETSH